MNFKKLGNTDLKVSTICLGTMTWGEQNGQKEAFEQMNYAFNCGVNFFDAAEIYPSPCKEETYGETERIIGNWFNQNKSRDKVILASKIAGPGLPWIRNGGQNFSEQKIKNALEDSLQRLQTDYIDLYQLHWPERKTNFFGRLNYKHKEEDVWNDFEKILIALEKFIKQGKIRYIGLSNETPWGLLKFLEVSKIKKLPKMMSVQNPYNLLCRTYEIGLSEISVREKSGLLAYSPLAGGRLSGKYMNGKRPKNCRYTLWPGRFSRHLTKRGELAIAKYVNLAKKYNIPPSTFANAFVINRPFVTSSIIGATSVKHLEENINCTDINLTAEMLNEIEDIHLSDPNPCI